MGFLPWRMSRSKGLALKEGDTRHAAGHRSLLVETLPCCMFMQESCKKRQDQVRLFALVRNKAQGEEPDPRSVLAAFKT